MANSKNGRIIAIATSVCGVLTGIAFIIAVAHLYFTGGDEPYSRERVGEYLVWLMFPSVITLALVITGIVYNIKNGVTDVEGTKRTNSELLKSFEKRYTLDSFDQETITAINAEKKRLTMLNVSMHSVSALLFVFSFVYLAFLSDYSVENLNAAVIAALAVSLPLAAIGLAVQAFRIYQEEKSAAFRLDIMKSYIKNNGAPKVVKAEGAADAKTDYTVYVKYAILGLSVLLIILGIFNGGMADVLEKAVKICTECIGLG